MEKKKAVAITVVFLTVLFGLALFHLCLPDRTVSRAERRKLAQTPEISADAVLSGAFAEDLEDYLLDQFPLREQFRTIHAALRFYAFFQSDNDGIYLHDGGAYKIEDPLDEKQVSYAAEKMNEVRSAYLQEAQVYYAVVPDKNAVAQNDRPHLDHDSLCQILSDNLQGMREIELWSLLSPSDYYRTDPHWRQEQIYPVAERIAEEMGVELPEEETYTQCSLSPFYGAYYGQAALPLEADTLTYLTSHATETALVTCLPTGETSAVYRADLFDGMDGYDVYLSGAQPIVVIEQPEAVTDRELIIFRDSFASSIAPYFIGAYRKITLIDLRYIPASMLNEYVEFGQQDVLFLLSTSVLNRGMLLR